MKALESLKRQITKLLKKIRKFVKRCKATANQSFGLIHRDDYAGMLFLAGRPKGFPTIESIAYGQQTYYHIPITMRELCTIVEKAF